MGDAFIKITRPTYAPDPIPASVRVVKVTGTKGNERYTPLRNVRPLSASWREGGDPPTAEFNYVFDDTTVEYAQATAWERKVRIPPTRYEDVFPLDAPNRYVLHPDDRIAVLMDRPDGTQVVLFDGYVLAPDAQVSKDAESCPFAAMGYPVREFDTPLPGALWRGSDQPTKGKDGTFTDLPARFNPDGRGNATPYVDDGSGGNSADYKYAPVNYTAPPFPIFMEPDFDGHDPTSGTPTATVLAREWTLAMAVKYIIAMGNPSEQYVRRPDFKALDSLLKARRPVDETALTYDPADSSTYVEEDIICHDYDCTDKPWPLAVAELIAPHGFGCAWRLDTTRQGKPDWWLNIYRKDVQIPVKSLRHQVAGEAVDSARSNTTALSLTRDSREIINAFAVQTEPCRYQAWFYLAPAFAINAADADAPNAYTIPDGDVTYTNDAYRLFTLNENGSDGFWDGTGWNYTPTDLRKLIQEDGLEPPPVSGGGDPASVRKYAIRRRPAFKTLFETDPSGKPIQAKLYIVTGDTGKIPRVRADATGTTGTFRLVNNGGWKLLDDRCGIRLTMKNPNDWDIGKKEGETYFANGKVSVVQCLARPTTPLYPNFVFALQCVIEGDRGINSLARKRAASPTKYTVLRRDDARDNYKQRYVLDPTGLRYAIRDDAPAAQAHAEARRAAHELPKIAGQATIPRIVTYYFIGDKIDRVVGRNCSLRTSIAATQKEGAQYMTLVGLDHRFDPEFATVLVCEDHRAEPILAGKEGDLES